MMSSQKYWSPFLIPNCYMFYTRSVLCILCNPNDRSLDTKKNVPYIVRISMRGDWNQCYEIMAIIYPTNSHQSVLGVYKFNSDITDPLLTLY